MANFDVNPVPYIPDGFDLEQWARPARGRMIIEGNPPRCHEELAIATLTPAPQQNAHQLRQAIAAVIEYFEEQRQVHIVSAWPSPLGLCLLQFRSALTKQAMINRNPHLLPDGTQIILGEHDTGLNLRVRPFSSTCWVMFLCFPLDFQTKDYIQQAVNHFGTVLTWTNNSHFKSRVLVRCSVLHISRIPRSVIVCKSAAVGGAGQSWTVPVFVLNSQNNDQLPGDEDPVPEEGNPHPLPGVLPDQQNPNFLDNLQDLDDVEQATIDEGWAPPVFPNAAAAAMAINNDRLAWPQEGEAVDQNELQQVQAHANAAVQQVVLQHPEATQSIESVNSEVLGFFRAQGNPIRLELPLLENHHAIVPHFNNNMDKESDYPILQLAKTIGIHLGFGPSPSAQMLLQDILYTASLSHHNLYVQRPLNLGLSQFHFTSNHQQQTHLEQSPLVNWFAPRSIVVDPSWDNNRDAPASLALNEADLQLAILADDNNQQLGQTTDSVSAEKESQNPDAQSETSQEATVKPAPKRKPRNRPTPIVDDELRRSTRTNKSKLSESKSKDYIFYTLPERKRSKQQTAAPVPEPAQLKERLEIEQANVFNNNQMIPVPILQDLGAQYCEVPPSELTSERLHATVSK